MFKNFLMNHSKTQSLQHFVIKTHAILKLQNCFSINHMTIIEIYTVFIWIFNTQFIKNIEDAGICGLLTILKFFPNYTTPHLSAWWLCVCDDSHVGQHAEFVRGQLGRGQLDQVAGGWRRPVTVPRRLVHHRVVEHALVERQPFWTGNGIIICLCSLLYWAVNGYFNKKIAPSGNRKCMTWIYQRLSFIRRGDSYFLLNLNFMHTN